MKQNHYDTLKIGKDASQKDIKLSYRKLALQNHPDRTGKATDEQFREVQEAYSVLSDPMRKREYDLTNGSAGLQSILVVTVLAMIYLVYKISTFLPILLLCLLTINASKLGRSRALPLTFIILSFTSGWQFLFVWVISVGSNLSDVEWLFWGVLYASLFDNYLIISLLVTLTWTIEQTRLGQRLINLSPLIVVLKVFILKHL